MRFRYIPDRLKCIIPICMSFVMVSCRKSDPESHKEPSSSEKQIVKPKCITKEDVVGCWNGKALGYKKSTRSECWIVKRSLDGTLLKESHFVNYKRNIYCVITPLTEGTWTMEGRTIIQRLPNSEPEVLPNVNLGYDLLTWELDGPGVPAGQERCFVEGRDSELKPLFGENSRFGKEFNERFKRVTIEELEEFERQDDQPPSQEEESQRIRRRL